MWDLFAIACVACFIFLFLPGFLFFRGLGFKSSRAFVAAPMLSAAVYPMLGILLDKMGMRSSWELMFGTSLAVGIAVFVVGAATSAAQGIGWWKSRSASMAAPSSPRWLIILLYLACGVCATLLVFVFNLDGADSFVQEYDNVHHLALIQTFVDSGNWSSLTSSFYSGSDPTSVNPIPGNAFYPAGWHCVAAMLVDCCGVPTAVAANAVNAVFCAVVYPMGMWLLLGRLFGGDERAVAAGAFCCFAFSAFPWKLMAWGPIFPNFAALCMFPALAALFMMIFEEGAKRVWRIASSCAFVVGLVAVALMQPNVAFTTMVFLIPFCAASIRRWFIRCVSLPDERSAHIKGAVAAVVFCLLAIMFWCALFVAPPLQSLVTFTWPAYVGKLQAITNILTLSFKETSPQIVLGFLVIVGAVILVRRRKKAWLVVSYAVMCGMYAVCAATDGFAKQLLTGFWYADAMRLGANAALFAVPLASVGLAGAVTLVGDCVSRLIVKGGSSRFAGGCAVAAAALVLACVFSPVFPIPGSAGSTAFGATCDFISRSYSASTENVLNPEEREFLEQVVDVVPEGAVVVNEPNDGSAYGYGLYGINLYYRSMSGYGESNETSESVAIRTGIDEIAFNERVRTAIDKVGAKYLLLLDQGDEALENRYLFTYCADLWTGVDGIDDNTPGFETVLSSGDMRLYKIL